ncbi:MAG TPA: dethiobiotin synthase [Nocardioidaceae bacterium]|nr:dethiobiotin synthase [Nocardioidaceae bacterium]
MKRFVVVTGTGTGVGKTVVTAALATSYSAHDLDVAVVKPVQTGLLGGEPGGDVDEIAALSGVFDIHEFVRLEDPLAPDSAARLRDVEIPTVAELAERVAAVRGDVVLVEGTGGVLVRLDREGGTIIDLILDLRARNADVDVLVVTSPDLGTLNHTELAVEALRHRGIEPSGLIIGSWPNEPDLAQRCNREDLPRVTGVPLLTALAELDQGRWPHQREV